MFSRPWKVMTRNVYVGADIAEPLRAVAGSTGSAALDALGHANYEVLRAAEQTDFGVRARLLAREIAAAEPDLIGLQEMALWRRGPICLGSIGRLDADEVIWDFLEMLLTELDAAGSPYAVGHVFEGADVEAPAFTGSASDASMIGHDVRLTMRDVILVRAGADILIRTRYAQAFERHLQVEVAGTPFSFGHGFAWVDVECGTDQLRFVTTHLDSESSDVALAQSIELTTSVTKHVAWPVIVVGDFNSDPDDASVRSGDPSGTAGSGPYKHLTESAGFLDCSAQDPRATFGFTAQLRDADASGFDHRIDFVFVRPCQLEVSSTVTGVSPADRDHVTGLWPSDHAGVLVTLR